MTQSKNAAKERWRTFHLTGKGCPEAWTGQRLRPAALAAVMPNIEPVESIYPIYVAPGKEPQPLSKITGSALARAVLDAMEGKAWVAAAEARTALARRGVSAADLPAGGWLIGFHRDAAVLLFASYLTDARETFRSKFLLRLKQSVVQLRDLLAVDDAHHSPPSIDASSLGNASTQFLTAAELDKAVKHVKGARLVMDPERRARCESILATLEQAVADANTEPKLWLFCSAEVPDGLGAFGIKICASLDPCAEALEFCDRQLGDFGKVLRALEAAQFELNWSFDADVHSAMIERIDWQSAGLDELAALPAVAVLEPAERLAQLSLTSFSRLMRAGRPIHLLVLESGLFADDLTGSTPEFGAIAVAHREAFVLQTSLSRWEHLATGLSAASRSSRPSVAVISTPSSTGQLDEAWLASTLLYSSRAFATFTYDPDAGAHWTEQFQWMQSPTEGIGPLHAIAFSNQFRDHFRIVPESDWSDDQMDASEYLDQFGKAPPLKVPFLLVTNGDCTPTRAAFTRELANLCRDRARAWQSLADMAAPRQQTVQEAQDPESARKEGASQAFEQVLALLSDPEKLLSGARSGS